jgi:uncharacterized membrane protein
MSDIKHELSIIYTLEYIGFIERGNWTMVKLVKCMLHVVGFQFKSWAITFIVEVHVLNIIVTQNLHVTLIEALNDIKVDVNHIGVFGCDPYTHIPK